MPLLNPLPLSLNLIPLMIFFLMSPPSQASQAPPKNSLSRPPIKYVYSRKMQGPIERPLSDNAETSNAAPNVDPH